MRFLSDHTLVDYVLIRKLIEHNWLDILRMQQVRFRHEKSRRLMKGVHLAAGLQHHSHLEEVPLV